jgi:hypothetical protein
MNRREATIPKLWGFGKASAASFHESAHAVAATLAFRNARWLPFPAPAPPVVRYVEIVQDALGWSGSCVSKDIYSVRWPDTRISERYRNLMELQIGIDLAGGIAEAIHRGQWVEVMTDYAMMDGDYQQARTVLSDLYWLTGICHDLAFFITPTRAMLTALECC